MYSGPELAQPHSGASKKRPSLDGGHGSQEDTIKDREDQETSRANDGKTCDPAVPIGEGEQRATSAPESPPQDPGAQRRNTQGAHETNRSSPEAVAELPVGQREQQDRFHCHHADEHGPGHTHRTVPGGQDDTESHVERGLKP
jgi:hypothetical protein